MTPVEELRAAAAKLRKRGGEATPGPWDRPLNIRYKNVVAAAKPDDEQGKYLDGRPEQVGVVMLNTWSDGTFMRKRGGRDLEWIALAHPGLAEPLAAWLESWDGIDFTEDGAMLDDLQYALRIARVINGSTS